nr:hypothetical protein [Tanacetum cinerariifolium]
MLNAASTSNPSFIVDVGEAYPYPSHVIAPNFVTVKLSGRNKYNMWKTQILCLLKSHQMYGFIDGKFPSPAGNEKGKVGDMEAWTISDSLVKGWILASLSEQAVNKAVNHLTHKQKKTDFTAKDLWDELQRSYGPPVREQATVNPWDKVPKNGNTILHIAVGSSTKNQELLKKLLEMTPKDTLLDVVNSDGSTLLHVAALGGNIEAVNILVERNPELLKAKDKEAHTPLALSVFNMHIETSKCLFEHMKVHGYGAFFSGQSGEDIVVLAISCQDFSLANMIIHNYPEVICSDSDAVLTALAQNFPCELYFWERGYTAEIELRLNPYKLLYSDTYNYVDQTRCLRRSKKTFIFIML